MRVIALGFVNESTIEVLSRLVKEFDIDACEFFYIKPNAISKKFPTSSYQYLDVQKGDYGINWNDISPLDGNLINVMAYCETVVLRMFDRSDLWFPVSYEERKQIYLKHLRFWNHVITQRKMEVCLITGIPHGIFDYVCYELCKHHNIPILMLTCPSLVMHTVFITDTWQEPAIALRNEFERLQKLRDQLPSPEIQLSEKYKNILASQSDIKKDPVPYYMAPKLINDLLEKPPAMIGPVFKKIIKIITPSSWSFQRLETVYSRIASGIKLRSVVRSIAGFYRENAKAVDLSLRYVYVPLHLQPECTTSPMAGSYTEQQLIIQLLASTLPSDVFIYVKEHPVQMQYGIANRSIDFYRELLAIPNVRLVPLEQNTFRLIDNSEAIAAATGSAGWEGIFRGKPYLMFGHHVYQYAPGVYPIRTTEDCKNAIHSIFEKKSKPLIEDIKLFLKAFENTAVNADAVDYRISVSPLSLEENTNNLFVAFSSAICTLRLNNAEK